MKLLILGGTREAKTIARTLHHQGVTIVYSIAGLVRQPDLPCKIIRGGFTKYGGLAQYIQENQITGILDATHPFAEKISRNAELATLQTGIPRWHYQRPLWQATPQDQWRWFQDWGQLVRQLTPYQSIFLSQGQLSEPMLAALVMHRKPNQRFIHRTAVKPKHRPYQWMECIQSIGPFSLESELELLKKHRTEVIVSKHSGGDIPAKLLAARKLNIPAMLLERADTLGNTSSYNNIPDLINAIVQSA